MSLDERVPLDSDVWKIVRLHGIGLEQLDIYWHRAIQYLELRWKKHVFKAKRDAIAYDLRREGYTVRTGKLSGLDDMKRELRKRYETLKFFKRRSVRDVLENPRADEFYVLVTRYYPIELRRRRMKFEDSPFQKWDRDLAPSPELLSDAKKHLITWEQYTKRFLEEVPPALIKRKAETYKDLAKGKKVVFVCIEEDWEFPHCHTWIILDVLKGKF